MKQADKRVNDLVLFFLTFAYTLAVLLSQTWTVCLFWTVLSILQLQIAGRIRWKYVLFFILLLVVPSLSLLITSYLHLKGGISGQPVIILGKTFDNYKLQISLYLMIRSWSLSVISFTYLTAIRYDRLIYSLIQNLGFPVSWGYALLVSFNAVGNLRGELERIRQAAMMRFMKKPLFYFYIIPLLVSATRYSQQAAMSIQTRGLNQKKSFIISAKLGYIDIAYLVINIAGILISGSILSK